MTKKRGDFVKITTIDGKVYENKTCNDCFYKEHCMYSGSKSNACDKYVDKKEWMDILEKGMK